MRALTDRNSAEIQRPPQHRSKPRTVYGIAVARDQLKHSDVLVPQDLDASERCERLCGEFVPRSQNPHEELWRFRTHQIIINANIASRRLANQADFLENKKYAGTVLRKKVAKNFSSPSARLINLFVPSFFRLSRKLAQSNNLRQLICDSRPMDGDAKNLAFVQRDHAS